VKIREPRYDFARVARYVAANSAQLPRRELETYVRFWTERMSVAEVARDLGVTKSTVAELIRRLRRKAAAGPTFTGGPQS
jgi:transposase